MFRDAGKAYAPKVKNVNVKCKHCTEVAPDMFKCNKLGNKTNHHQCTNCNKNFPERMEYDQFCFTCDRPFCNLYWPEECDQPPKNPVRFFKPHEYM